MGEDEVRTRARSFGAVAAAYAVHRPGYSPEAVRWAVAPTDSASEPEEARGPVPASPAQPLASRATADSSSRRRRRTPESSTCGPSLLPAAGAVHGTSYFKMLDDAAFYASNSLVTDRFLLTTAFNLLLTRPLKAGPVIAEGRWISGKRRVFVADARLIDGDGEEAARGTGTFMRSRIPLADLPGYRTT